MLNPTTRRCIADEAPRPPSAETTRLYCLRDSALPSPARPRGFEPLTFGSVDNRPRDGSWLLGARSLAFLRSPGRRWGRGSAPGFSPIRETTASPRRSISQTSEHSKKRDQFNYSLLGRQTSGTWRAIIGCNGETCGDGVPRSFADAGVKLLYADSSNGESDADRFTRTVLHAAAEQAKRDVVANRA